MKSKFVQLITKASLIQSSLNALSDDLSEPLAIHHGYAKVAAANLVWHLRACLAIEELEGVAGANVQMGAARDVEPGSMLSGVFDLFEEVEAKGFPGGRLGIRVRHATMSSTAGVIVGFVPVDMTAYFDTPADNNRCKECDIDLDSPSAAGAEDGVCGPCIEDLAEGPAALDIDALDQYSRAAVKVRIEHLAKLETPGPVNLGTADNAVDQDSLFHEIKVLRARLLEWVEPSACRGHHMNDYDICEHCGLDMKTETVGNQGDDQVGAAIAALNSDWPAWMQPGCIPEPEEEEPVRTVTDALALVQGAVVLLDRVVSATLLPDALCVVLDGGQMIKLAVIEMSTPGGMGK